MVGAKVSIVTHKVQTTRARIRGIAMHGGAQVVFVDTPGIFRPRRRLDRSMVAAAWGVPRLGVAMTITLMVGGQLLLSLALDHFGALGVPRQPLNIGRVAGVGLVLAGVLLVRRS